MFSIDLTIFSVLSILLTLPFFTEAVLLPRGDCKPCAPSGAKSTAPPPVGPDLAPLYVDLLEAVKGINFRSKRNGGSILESRAGSKFCCVENTSCLLLPSLSLPFCYDKFTTNFLFPDGSFGTVANGSYAAQDGSRANLLTGEVSGSDANIYASGGGSSGAPKPDPATLSIPPQFTGTGVGAAIPGSALGSVVLTTVVGPTTVPGTTVGTRTRAPVTVTGEGVTATVTLETVAAAAATSKGGVGRVRGGWGEVVGGVLGGVVLGLV